MTARDAARRQPTSAKRAVLFEGFDRIRGAAWIITAGGGEQRTERYLVAANQKDKNGTHWTRLPVSDVGRRLSRRVGGRGAGANREHVAAQTIELGIVGLAPSADRDVGCGAVAQRRQQLDAGELAQPALQSVAIDRGMLMTRHNDPDTRKAKRGSVDPDIEIRGPDTLPLSNDCLYVSAPRETMLARKTEAVVTRLRTCLAA